MKKDAYMMIFSDNATRKLGKIYPRLGKKSKTKLSHKGSVEINFVSTLTQPHAPADPN
jgi:hypothetical protein